MAPGSTSAATSPLFTPSSGNLQGMNAEVQRFSLTSPALKPQQENTARERSDREAMAALLMLNSDRRTASTWRDGNGSGGENPREGQSQSRGQTHQSSARTEGRSRQSAPMSVRDLLSH